MCEFGLEMESRLLIENGFVQAQRSRGRRMGLVNTTVLKSILVIYSRAIEVTTY